MSIDNWAVFETRKVQESKHKLPSADARKPPSTLKYVSTKDLEIKIERKWYSECTCKIVPFWLFIGVLFI